MQDRGEEPPSTGACRIGTQVAWVGERREESRSTHSLAATAIVASWTGTPEGCRTKWWKAKLAPKNEHCSRFQGLRLACRLGLHVQESVVEESWNWHSKGIEPGPAVGGEKGQRFYLQKLKPRDCFGALGLLILCVVSSGNHITLNWKLSLVTCQKDLEPLLKALYTLCLFTPITHCARWESSHRQVCVAAVRSPGLAPPPSSVDIWNEYSWVRCCGLLGKEGLVPQAAESSRVPSIWFLKIKNNLLFLFTQAMYVHGREIRKDG